jgi:signal transduction histidine kinase
MDVAVTRTRNLLLMAALAVILLGLGASYLTWQNVSRQRRVVREHMAHSGQAMFRGIESAIAREMRGEIMERMRGMRLMRDPEAREELERETKSLLDEIVQDKDVDFLAVYSPERERLLFSSAEGLDGAYEAPDEAWNTVERRGSWIAVVNFDGREILVVISESRHALAAFSGEFQGGMGMMRGMRGPRGGRPYLVLGMNVARYMQTYRNFERNAYLQTGYVLLVALVLLGLALAYARRREQGMAYDRLERFHSRLLDTMPDGLLTVGSGGEVRAANPAAARLLVSEDEELVGRRWRDLGLKPKDDAAGGSDREGIERGQYEFGGRTLEILSRPIPGADEESEPQRLVLVRDRTEVQALERELAQAEKLAAVGRLAAGLAHEIRNPLSSLRGFAQYFRDRFKGEDEIEEYAGIMVDEADRLNRVVTDMLFLAKPRPLSKRNVSLRELAGEIERLLERDVENKGATVHTDFEVEEVRADRDQLKQALLNLALNSLEAAPDNAGEINIFSRREDGGVRVGVADNGRGMSEEERKNAMEPFFTGRADGTGLGLSVVHKIMRDHGGRVEIESEKGEGATVALVFPEDDGAER